MEAQCAEAHTKSLNVIVSGLPQVSGVTDKVLFEKFCEDHLTVKPPVVRIRRLGRVTDGNSSKLCVTLDSPSSATSLVDSSSILRQSTTHSCVFINHDLTRAQAEAAFRARATKRAQRAGAPPVLNSQLPNPTDQPFSSV